MKNVGRYFQIVAGERRFLAFKKLGKATIPARVLHITDARQELEISLIENLQRQELDPVEEARALRRLVEDFRYTYRQLADRLGKSVGYIDSRLKLVSKPDVEEAVRRMELGVAEARELARVEDDTVRKELTDKVVAGELDRDQLREQVKQLTGRTSDPQTGLTRVKKALQSLHRALDLSGPIVLDEEAAALTEQAVVRLEGLVRSKQAPTRAAGPSFRHAVGDRGDTGLGPRDVLSRVKQMQDPEGYSLHDRILGFWRSMDRAGRQFRIGPWECLPRGEDRWTVRLKYVLDGTACTADWEYLPREGLLHPLNDEARFLSSGGQR